MKSRSSLDYWCDLESRQSEWAFRAYGRLIQTLSKEVQEKLSRKEDADEPYVVIFGKTQVGKTTLLLDLMGIDPDQQATVSQVLRGGRETGKSATATAMEYCRSVDSRWGLSIEGSTHWFNSNETISERLGELRRDMEAGNLVAKSPCVVHIPKQFFVEDGAISPHVRILDLPGDNPANREEQEHVHQMAKVYLPFADLVLLVGRGDDLGFLRPEVITLPGIEDWQTMPHRFRIVTTYSYTAQSIKDFIRDNAQFDVAQLRQRLIQQIELFGTLSDPAKSEALYFPLEFGTSWMGVQQHDSLLYTRMAPIIEKLRSELLAQIAQSTSPMGRLRSTLNTHLGVKHILKRKTALFESTIVQLEKKCDQLMGECGTWDKAVERAEKTKKYFDMLLVENETGDSEREVRDAAKKPEFSVADPYPPKEGNDKDNVAILKRLTFIHQRALQGMRLVINPLTRQSIKYWRVIHNHLEEPNEEVVQEILNDSFASIRSVLNDYWIDTYLDSSNYQEDRRKVLEASLDAKEKVIDLFVKAWLKAISKAHSHLKNEQQVADAEFYSYRDECDRARDQIDKIQLSRLQRYSEMENITRRSQEDLERCDKFIDLLDEEYLQAINKQMTHAILNEDDCESMLQLLSCEEMRYQRENLMVMKQQKTG